MDTPSEIDESRDSRLRAWVQPLRTMLRPVRRAARRLFDRPEPDRPSTIGIGSFGGFEIAFRQGTADELVIAESLDHDMFFAGFPEYRPAATDVVVDVGAHIGTFALLAASKLPAGKVFAVEASLDSFNLLRINLALNGYGNVEARHLALADEEGTCTLFHDVGNWGNSAVAELSKSSETVECWTLAQYLDRSRIDRCHFLKMNCEGSEFPILLSTPKSALERIDNALVLYHCDLWKDNGEGDLVSHLEAAGFDCAIRNRTEQRGWIIATRTRSAS